MEDPVLPALSPSDRAFAVLRRALLIAPALLALALVAGGCALQSASAPAAPPAPASFPGMLIQRGAQLAAVGNCVSCHTAKGGKPFAGGLPLETPFGTIHGTNITPDPDTGIGRWSEADFTRALREGIDRAGRHLFPVFPYDHFTLTTDDDVRALYVFIMTREPVRAETPANSVIIPRPFIAIWKKLYFEPGVFQPDPSRDAVLNRGAYLAEGLGHCSSCHTPRDKLGAEVRSARYNGGEVGGWHAPALNGLSRSPVPWTPEAMAAYLRTGIADAHAIAAGPMAGVVRNLGRAAPDDVQALARYAAALDTRPAAVRAAQAARTLSVPPRGRAPASGPGAIIYAGACADCHDRGRAADGGALPLPQAIAPALPTPANLIHIIRDGIVPQADEHARWMPDFASALTGQELIDLVMYIRTFTDYPPWSDVPAAVRAANKADQ